MKKQLSKLSLVIILCSTNLLFSPNIVFGEGEQLEQKNSVTVVDAKTTKPVDPENPGNEVNPGGESPSTEGSLRIDYVPTLNFSTVPIKKKGRTYYALAQQFLDATPARGSYFQITDRRENASGWSIQVKQTRQFHNDTIKEENERELKGTVLSLDKGWANSHSRKAKPTVTRDTIAIESIDTAYTIATARSGEGKGVWTVEFGASGDNEAQQENTLVPLKDENGKPIMDPVCPTKQAVANTAISLNIPDAIKVHPVEYQMELTWLIGQLP